MRTLTRAAILMSAACGLCFALSGPASGDVVEPKSAYQPASTRLIEGDAAAEMAAADEAEAARGKAALDEEAARKRAAKAEKAVEPTPAPEQVVRRAVPAPVIDSATSNTPVSPVDRIVHPFRAAFQHIGASLGRAVSACEVGSGPATGGPVLVLAVLSMVIPFTRRRALAARRAADEDVRDLLYVWELTPPG